MTGLHNCADNSVSAPPKYTLDAPGRAPRALPHRRSLYDAARAPRRAPPLHLPAALPRQHQQRTSRRPGIRPCIGARVDRPQNHAGLRVYRPLAHRTHARRRCRRIIPSLAGESRYRPYVAHPRPGVGRSERRCNLVLAARVAPHRATSALAFPAGLRTGTTHQTDIQRARLTAAGPPKTHHAQMALPGLFLVGELRHAGHRRQHRRAGYHAHARRLVSEHARGAGIHSRPRRLSPAVIPVDAPRHGLPPPEYPDPMAYYSQHSPAGYARRYYPPPHAHYHAMPPYGVPYDYASTTARRQTALVALALELVLLVGRARVYVVAGAPPYTLSPAYTSPRTAHPSAVSLVPLQDPQEMNRPRQDPIEELLRRFNLIW